jgi:tetratricopeptide (TPR) repeat protein
VTEIIEWVERIALTDPNSIMALHFACQWAAEQKLIDLARRGLRQLERTLAIQDLPETAACLSEAHGHVAMIDNDFRSAIESLSEAVNQWAAQSRPYDQVRTLNGLSRALLELGNDAAAREACERALSIVETLNAQLDVEEMKISFLNSALVREIKNRRDQ